MAARMGWASSGLMVRISIKTSLSGRRFQA
jgi:hypothetical protein